MARLEIDGISKHFGASRVLEPLSLCVENGEFLVILGPSGCGKSTLLRIVAGLIEASSGELRLDGQRIDDLAPAERDVAMVFQNYALYPHMSVRDNIGFPLRVAGVSHTETAARVAETARTLGLDALLERKPAALSGGQMQRVALGRALIRRPRLFLFDEPLSNLDAKLRDELRHEIGALHSLTQTTTLYVTHDQVEAMTLGSRIALLEGGRLHQVGRPLEVFSRPATSFVAAFLGSPPMNLLRGEVRSGAFELGGSRITGAPVESGEVVLGLRPHEVEFGSSGAAARVEGVERLGHQTLARLSIGAQHAVVCREDLESLAPGQTVHLCFAPRAAHWFDARDGRRL
ncbi:MAG: ABC transporter ATP-binding protein [Planctomycetes bacterium]|nr:ABC transporter ATP-binding protein [Planctomycetota bacterium]